MSHPKDRVDRINGRRIEVYGMKPFPDADIELHPGETVEFLQRWFAGVGGYRCVVAIPQGVGKVGTRSFTLTEGEETGFLDEEAYSALTVDGLDRYNMYVNVATRVEAVDNVWERGSKDKMLAIPGVWVDLDCKDGSFASSEEIYRYIRSLDMRPTIGVATGSGGVHCYWKLDIPVDPVSGETLQRGWWAWLRARADGRSVDRLIDSTRIMKLPGSIRWPKATEIGVAPAEVRLLYSDGPTYSWTDLMDRSHSAGQEYVREVRARAVAEGVRREQVEQALGRDGLSWTGRMALASAQDRVDEGMSWREVLEPYGWTWIKEDSDGRHWWARPGGDGSKSATTDWPESPHVMSLLSDSPATGLEDLKEAGIPLTKYRVWLRLRWSDDEMAMIQSTLADGVV